MQPKLFLSAIGLCLLNACATANPNTPPTPSPKSGVSNGIPYPVPTVQDQISYLENKVIQLHSEIETLAAKVARLEQQHEKNSTAARKHPVQKLSDRKLKEHYLHDENTVPAIHTASQAQNTYRQALKHYKNGKYAAAAALLKGADGGDGGDTAQRSMYLLLQSNAGMGKCESVIEIGRRYSNRFKDSPQAPEALYKIGECQYRLQQKDIARATWRSLIQSYPGSAAAKRAAEAVKKR